MQPGVGGFQIAAVDTEGSLETVFAILWLSLLVGSLVLNALSARGTRSRKYARALRFSRLGLWLGWAAFLLAATATVATSGSNEKPEDLFIDIGVTLFTGIAPALAFFARRYALRKMAAEVAVQSPSPLQPGAGPVALPLPREPKPLGLTAARASLWCLGPALFLILSGAYLTGDIFDLRALRLSSVTLALAAAIAGLLLALAAVIAPGVTRKRILWLVLCGITGNALCISVISTWVVTEHGRKRQLAHKHDNAAVEEKWNSVQAEYDTTQKRLARVVDKGTTEDAGIAQAYSHMLQKQQTLIQAFMDSMKPLTNGHLLTMSNVTDRAEILRRRGQVEHMMASAKETEDFLQNLEGTVREELSQQGISGSSVERGLQLVTAKMDRPRQRLTEMAPLRNRWAEDELGALDLLLTNWGQWRYDAQAGKLKFRNNYQATEFNRLVHEINQTKIEMGKLQERFLEEK